MEFVREFVSELVEELVPVLVRELVGVPPVTDWVRGLVGCWLPTRVP